ncbi:MAG: hypothetical protein HYU52_02565 [Acidobacteria bacterium]|nr:hypothetical protein [Acidobacteriota bacterium]
MTPAPARLALTWLLLVGLAVGAFETLYLQMLRAHGRDGIRTALASMTDEPGYAAFLREVENRTEEGATIVILTPRPWGRGAYEYVYYRAVYLVDGRTILPALWIGNEPLFDNVRKADYIAAWGMPVTAPSHERVWSGAGGGLYRRIGIPQ